jgi:hypothetical protein
VLSLKTYLEGGNLVKCDAPGFQPELINPNDPVNSVDFNQMTVNLGITSKTSPMIPNDPFWSTIVNLGQNPTQNPLTPFDPPMSTSIFATFSEFHLNTSNSSNTKVVYFVDGHNFHVGWHCWFEVQIGEKCKSTLVGTVH